MQKIIHAFILCILLTACCTTGTENTVLEYQRQVDRLEEELRARDRTIVRNIERLEAVTSRSAEMGTDIDSIIREFDEYQRTIERILSDYRAIGAGSEDTYLRIRDNAGD